MNLCSIMATVAVNQLERQFAHLSVEEQLALLDRLALKCRLVVAGSNGAMETHPEVLAATHEVPREVDRSESRSAESDLLSEAW